MSHLDDNPLESVAVKVTTVTPSGNTAPDWDELRTECKWNVIIWGVVTMNVSNIILLCNDKEWGNGFELHYSTGSSCNSDICLLKIIFFLSFVFLACKPQFAMNIMHGTDNMDVTENRIKRIHLDTFATPALSWATGSSKKTVASVVPLSASTTSSWGHVELKEGARTSIWQKINKVYE